MISDTAHSYQEGYVTAQGRTLMRVRELIKCQLCNGSGCNGAVTSSSIGLDECPECGGDGHCLAEYQGENIDKLLSSLKED